MKPSPFAARRPFDVRRRISGEHPDSAHRQSSPYSCPSPRGGDYMKTTPVRMQGQSNRHGMKDTHKRSYALSAREEDVYARSSKGKDHRLDYARRPSLQNSERNNCNHQNDSLRSEHIVPYKKRKRFFNGRGNDDSFRYKQRRRSYQDFDSKRQPSMSSQGKQQLTPMPSQHEILKQVPSSQPIPFDIPRKSSPVTKRRDETDTQSPLLEQAHPRKLSTVCEEQPSHSLLAVQSSEEDSKAAVVSDGQTLDLFENSTTTSSTCCLSLENALDPPGRKLADIPRQIQTPTKSILELDEPIPRKSKSVQSIECPRSVGDETELEKDTISVSRLNNPTPTMTNSVPPESPMHNEVESGNLKIHTPCKEANKLYCEPRAPVISCSEAVIQIVSKEEGPESEATRMDPERLQERSKGSLIDSSLQLNLVQTPSANIAPSQKVSHVLPLESSDSTPQDKESISASPPKSSSEKAKMKVEYNRVQIGARVSVYWDGEDTFFHATVAKERAHKKKRFFLEYDDGDREWINLRKQRWRLLSGGRDPENPVKSKEDTIVRKSRTTGKSQSQAKDAKLMRDSPDFAVSDWIHDDQWVSKAAHKSDSDSETDDEEVMQFAHQMLGMQNESLVCTKKIKKLETSVEIKKPKIPVEPKLRWEDFGDVHIPISEKVKLGRRRTSLKTPNVPELPKIVTKKRKQLPDHEKTETAEADCASLTKNANEETTERRGQPSEDLDEAARRKKEESRSLTEEEVRAILGNDKYPCGTSTHWVRRSERMPSRSVLNNPKFKLLIEKLKTNDPDMVVLKVKKYLGDPDCPQICIDTVLDALEENTNCQSLYIQNFNEGMRDKQVLRLIEILKKPSCNIWCLNIGETYKVKARTWKAFIRGLKDTKITHMYASEHTISSELKEKIRSTIRENRSKHKMHIDPENLDVIVKCTHCWWNPINAKALRPHLQRKGYAHILEDGEAQGLRGTVSGADLE